MAASDKNQEYLDQVYYAIGNIHLNQGDTLQAIAAYEKGAAKSSRNGVEKGVLLLHLGNVYWQCHRYGDAKRCYDAAIGLLDQDRKDYAMMLPSDSWTRTAKTTNSSPTVRRSPGPGPQRLQTALRPFEGSR